MCGDMYVCHGLFKACTFETPATFHIVAKKQNKTKQKQKQQQNTHKITLGSAVVH